jgi:parallel beta-helix repeat protein
MNKKMNSRDIKIERIARRVKITLLIAILCFGIGVVTAIPQQPDTLYGTTTLNGKVLTAQDDDVVSLKVDGIELVSYTMGDISGTDNYVLKVPMDSDSSVTTAAQEGDTAYISINGIAINEGPQIIGAPGNTVKFDISATSTSNQLSLTVRYPNGGEAIMIGTQVQVSAHATDDTAVTDVTFYYSSDGGSNWDLIGEGVKVSGTPKDGTWNNAWNTEGLSAGTNYLIKAVASDGTSTSEDRSDRTFSVTSSKLIRVPDDYPTIQAAIDAASSGYKITVSSGTYFEHLDIGTPLKLIGEDKNTTIINGSGSGYCVHITADNVEISGFTIENGFYGVYLESSNGSIMDNNIISDHCEGISLSDSNSNLIAHNSLHNNGGYISGIHLSSSHNNVIRDNDLAENVGSVSLRDSNNNLIYHNNFVDNIAQASDNTGTNSWDNAFTPTVLITILSKNRVAG